VHAGHICAGTGLAPCHAYTRTGLIPAHICTGTGLTPPTSAPRLRSPLPHLHRDGAHPSLICTRTALTPPTSASGPSCASRAATPGSHAHSCAPGRAWLGWPTAWVPTKGAKGWALQADLGLRRHAPQVYVHKAKKLFLIVVRHSSRIARLGVFNCVPRALFRNRVPFFLSVLPLFRNRVPLFLSDVPLATEAAGRSVAAVLRAHAERATMRWPGGVRSSGGRAVMVFDRFRSNVWLTPCRICTGIGPNPCFI
jgi:hypothetical protein